MNLFTWLSTGLSHRTWFFCFRDISKDSVMSFYRLIQRFTFQILEKAKKINYNLSIQTYPLLPGYFRGNCCFEHAVSLGEMCLSFSLEVGRTWCPALCTHYHPWAVDPMDGMVCDCLSWAVPLSSYVSTGDKNKGELCDILSQACRDCLLSGCFLGYDHFFLCGIGD